MSFSKLLPCPRLRGGLSLSLRMQFGLVWYGMVVVVVVGEEGVGYFLKDVFEEAMKERRLLPQTLEETLVFSLGLSRKKEEEGERKKEK